LFEGDHFGEIGLLFGCKRTATVKSVNYGALALLRKSAFNELQKIFENMSNHFKKQIFKYNDEVTQFIEMELNKISYFKDLSMTTK